MKHFATAMVLLAGSAAAFGADAAPMTGVWKVHNSVANNDSDQECTFTQTGKVLAGSCTLEGGKSVQVTGSVDDKKVTWQYGMDFNGTALTLIYTATLTDSAKVTGAIDVEPFGVTGEFSATAANAAEPVKTPEAARPADPAGNADPAKAAESAKN